MAAKGARRKTKPSPRGDGARKKRTSGKAGSGLVTDLVRVVGWLTARLPLALFVLAALSLAAMFPLDLFGPAGSVFPSGNPVGAWGDALNGLLRRFAGEGRFAAPFVLLAMAATAGKRLSPAARKRLWIVSVAALVLVPVSFFLPEPAPVADATASEGADAAVADRGGFVGATLGGPLREQLGWLGAWVVVGVGVLTTSVAAFGFNPLRTLGEGTGRLWEVARRRTSAGFADARSVWARLGRSRARGRGLRRGGDAGSHEDAGAVGSGANATPFGGDSEAGLPAGAFGHEEEPSVGDPAPRGATDAMAATGVAPEPAPPEAEHELPGIELLTEPEHQDRAGMMRDLDRLGGILVDTLETFNIRCEVGGRTTGPAVTQYEVVPAAGVKVNRIANLDADLALAMKAHSVRIVAPIPGKGAVGVEIPNPNPEMVRLREILEAPAFVQSPGVLPLALGKDLAGHPFVSDLAKMPHALIAGATGSGKSVCLNTVITSLVYRAGPSRLRLLLIDPKMVELSAYADLPHLRHPVVTDPKDAAGVLKWAVLEMERRYALLSANGVRSLKEFNERVARGVTLKRPGEAGAGEQDGGGDDAGEDWWIYTDGPLPYIVVVVDELADLMMTVQAEVEKPLTQLAQKARAIGIHLLVATQRPSVNVITGLIKANFPCRIAFRVASKTDSRTILDQNGADALLGYGDMLFLPPGHGEPVRMQGAYISTEETEALMDWYREQASTPEAAEAGAQAGEDDILATVRAIEGAGEDGPEPVKGEWDDLFREAAEACIQQGAGSTSLLQRRLRIGYGRAARIVDQLHDAGVLGPPDGSKPREVTATAESLDEICPG